MPVLRKLLAISSAVQHGQLVWQILEWFGLGRTLLLSAGLAAAGGVGAIMGQQPWYWILSLVISIFAGLMIAWAALVYVGQQQSAAWVAGAAVTLSVRDQTTAKPAEVTSEGFIWSRGQYTWGERGTFPHCPEHRTRLVYRYKGDYRDKLWKTAELRWQEPGRLDRNSLAYDGHLFCSFGAGHNLGWFPESNSFEDAQRRAEMLIKQELAS